MPIIALLTDFGLRDTYVAQMHGVIAGRNSSQRVIDVTHAIPPQNILAGAYALDDAVDAFPPETIFVVVIDPGVGSARRAIAAEFGSWRFVGPDNGLLSVVGERFAIGTVVELSNEDFHRPRRSATFHGRDIFAPAAAALALGTSLRALGSVITDPLTHLDRARPTRWQTDRAITVSGIILDADHYGNLRSNLRRSDVFPPETEVTSPAEITLDRQPIGGLSRCYADGGAGDVLALFGSNDRLEIAVCQGSAAARFPHAHSVVVTFPSC